MSRFVGLFVCAFAIVAIAGVAQAATVDLVLTVAFDDTWTLTAQAGLDNGGIQGYNITLNYLWPNGQSFGVAPLGHNNIHGDLSELIPTGFRIGNGDSDPNQDVVTIFGGQVGYGNDLTDPISVIFGVGNTAGVTVDGRGSPLPGIRPPAHPDSFGPWQPRQRLAWLLGSSLSRRSTGSVNSID